MLAKSVRLFGTSVRAMSGSDYSMLITRLSEVTGYSRGRLVEAQKTNAVYFNGMCQAAGLAGSVARVELESGTMGNHSLGEAALPGGAVCRGNKP